MIQAVLQAQPYIVPAILIGSVLVSCLLWLLKRPTGVGNLLSALFAISISIIVATTLTPNIIRSALPAHTCDTSLTASEIFSTQGMLNAVLFFLPTFLGVLLFGYPISAISASFMSSILIEILQLSFPAIGRFCDITDVYTNSIGGLLGGTFGFILAKRSTYFFTKSTPRLNGHKVDLLATIPIVITCVSLLLVIFSSGKSDAPSGRLAAEGLALDKVNSAVVERALNGLLGESRISGMKLQPPPAAKLDPILTVRSGMRQIDFSWPNLEPVRGIFNKAPVPLSAIEPNAPLEAFANSYVARNFPWALDGTEIFTYTLDAEKGEHGIGWRKRINGILMPLRMDVFLDDKKRVIGFLARNLASPKLPPALIGEREARSIAIKKRAGKILNTDLRAVLSGDEWVPQWMVEIGKNTSSQDEPSDYILINANDGSIMH
ncbi:VanZ family protein [Microbispora siamensis]